MKNVLITGGAGFIGSHLAYKFRNSGYNVIIIDNLFRGKKENIIELLDQNNLFINIDLVAENSIHALTDIILLYNPVYILHYAAINGTQYFYDIPQKVVEVNSISTYNLMSALKAAKKDNVNLNPEIIFASTSETYGEPLSVPTYETDLTYVRISEERDSYAVAKLVSEFYVKLFCQSLGLNWIIFRIFNVYGKKMIDSKYGQVIPEFIARLKDGEYPLKIFGDGSHTRSFIYINDHVEMTYQAILQAKRNEVYNLGNPDEISILQLATLIMSIMQFDPKFVFLSERSGDHKRRIPNITKLTEQIGDFNFTSLTKGLESIIL